jgi:hypothetical protein
MDSNRKRNCLYCGKPTGRVGKGEHLIPKALGGRITTKHVCGSCNNTFSDIDRELCSRSPLSFVAAKEIDAHLWLSWDVDERTGILLEGRPDFGRQSFKLFPQMLIFPYGEQLWADYSELRQFGVERFQILFRRRLRKAFWEYKQRDKKAIRFVKIPDSEGLLRRHNYPPRFFVRGTLAEACGAKTIELGFTSRLGWRLAMSRLDSGMSINPLSQADIACGSGYPTIRNFFDAGKIWRALAKIGINLLHKYCKYTAVDSDHFSQVISEIIGTTSFKATRLRSNGFVHASDVDSIASDAKSHTFRMTWSEGRWHITMAFFGGQMGAYVNFPGPSQESWRTIDIRAPINSLHWAASTTSLVVPGNVHIEWLELSKLIPDGGFLETHLA